MTWVMVPIYGLNKTLPSVNPHITLRFQMAYSPLSASVTSLPNFKWSSRQNLHSRSAQLYSNSTSKANRREGGILYPERSCERSPHSYTPTSEEVEADLRRWGVDGCEKEKREKKTNRAKCSKNNDEMKLFSSADSGRQSFWISASFPVLMCNCSCLCPFRYVSVATVVRWWTIKL